LRVVLDDAVQCPAACAAVLQGVGQFGRLLMPYGLSRAEAASLMALNENVGQAFDQSLTSLLLELVR
jgi:hypothetical protein